MNENIDQMRERHKEEIKKLRDNCEHKQVSKCMPFNWAPAHISHCVKICENCGKELFTTYKGNPIGKEITRKGGMKEVVWVCLNETPKEKLFKCPKRRDCHFCRSEEKDL